MANGDLVFFLLSGAVLTHNAEGITFFFPELVCSLFASFVGTSFFLFFFPEFVPSIFESVVAVVLVLVDVDVPPLFLFGLPPNSDDAMQVKKMLEKER